MSHMYGKNALSSFDMSVFEPRSGSMISEVRIALVAIDGDVLLGASVACVSRLGVAEVDPKRERDMMICGSPSWRDADCRHVIGWKRLTRKWQVRDLLVYIQVSHTLLELTT